MCQLPEEEAIADYFGKRKNQYGSGMPMARISVLYDLLNEVSIIHTIEPNHVSEKETFINFRKSFDSKAFVKNHQCLYVMDRGYPSFTICKDLSLPRHSFVIRSKSSFCNEVKAFVKEDIAEKNICIPAKGRLVNGLEEDLDLRIVRILLNSEEYEYLLTNTDFSIQELNKIYRLRWGVETFYSFLKERMQLENFSSRTVEGLLQDFYANLLTANISFF
jgi:IS4 transposase